MEGETECCRKKNKYLEKILYDTIEMSCVDNLK